MYKKFRNPNSLSFSNVLRLVGKVDIKLYIKGRTTGLRRTDQNQKFMYQDSRRAQTEYCHDIL